MTKLLCSVFLAAVSLPCAAQEVLFLHNNSLLDSLQSITDSTVPSNGDLNPYGLAFVPRGFPSGGSIAPGDALVANFNSNSGLGGTGTTIVDISPTGQQTLFATSTLIGLDTALGVLSKGFVIVGNLPVTYPGGSQMVGQGSLQVFDRWGHLVAVWNDATLLDSPWDLTVVDHGAMAQVYVSNAVSGTVTRLNLAIGTTGITVVSKTRIGSGYGHQLIQGVVAVGPTGLAYDSHNEILYVASTVDNKIYGIGEAAERTTDAGTGFVVFQDQVHLHGPLGLLLSPNGHLIAANGDAVNAGGAQNDLVEFTRDGALVATYQLDGGAPGAAFGIASTVSGGTVRFAAVDDDLNTLTIWTLNPAN